MPQHSPDFDAFCADIIPPVCQEPSTHPEALPLLRLALPLVEPGQEFLTPAGLLVSQPSCIAPHGMPGVGVWWQGKLALLGATETHEVWVYHPGPWEASLRAVQSGSAPPRTTSAQTAGYVAEKQAIVAASLEAFQAQTYRP